ncbi:MAG: hypothetical protein QM730_28020 [Anaerolineales bacterium]
MKSKRPTTSFAPYEIWRFVFPLTFGTIIILVGIIIDSLIHETFYNLPLLLYVVLAIIYVGINSSLIARTTNYNESYGWANAILGGIGAGFFFYVLPEKSMK